MLPKQLQSQDPRANPERDRLVEDMRRSANWKRWGPYLAERQWGTVREDYSASGDCWNYFPHDHARSRAYRWGEDGLLGITDRECRLCFALGLWNGKDPILKERLFGLTGPEGNHGEDVKEEYFYLDATPTHSYLKALYRYPQAEYPYARLVEENRRRGRDEPEFELADTGVLDAGRVWDVQAEYAKASPDDVLVRITITNRGPEAATLHLLAQAWFRNTWVWGCKHEGCWPKPTMALAKSPPPGAAALIETNHQSLGRFDLAFENASDGTAPTPLFTDNHTNNERLFGSRNVSRHVKDAFDDRIVHGREDAVNPKNQGSKSAAWYQLNVPAGAAVTIRARLTGRDAPSNAPSPAPSSRPPSAPSEFRPFGRDFNDTFATRLAEADRFYSDGRLGHLSPDERAVARQAYAGLLWSKQFYEYVVADWLDGDLDQPAPPPERKARGARNAEWRHLYARDVILMPDKWEYPWFAAWDLAFHCVAAAHVDPQLAKDQLLLMTREWYMHPSGAIPAYEFAFGDVNPPVHAWACWRVYKITGKRGERDRTFLARCFHKLLLNFTWWVNRKDPGGRNVFGGGFLGLDNIGVFDRSRPLPTGGHLEQADGTAWMAFFCATMLSMALELAKDDPAYEDVASKFFEHFIAIIDAMNSLGGSGLWDDRDGFYYDQLLIDGRSTPLRVRSLVGVIPILACEVVEERTVERLPGFAKRMRWFLENRTDLARYVSFMSHHAAAPHAGEPGPGEAHPGEHGLLAIPSRERLERVLKYLFDESEFLSPYGVRSLSKFHAAHPYVFRHDGVGGNAGAEYTVEYTPGESATGLFGGNSNWRGPVWMPLNYLIIEALERYHHFYGETFTVELPAGSGRRVTLQAAADELRRRLASIFLPDPATGGRPLHGPRAAAAAADPALSEALLFHEYFHAETGRGLGASHQTGWTALIAPLLKDLAKSRQNEPSPAEAREGARGSARAGEGSANTARRSRAVR
jgi:hypothetical protein